MSPSTPSLLKIMQSLSCGLSLEPSVRSKSVGPYTDMFNDMFAAMKGPRTTRDLHIRDSIPHRRIGDLESIKKEVMPDGTTKRLPHDPKTGRVTQQVDAYSLNGYEQHVKNQGRIRWNHTTRSGLTIAQSGRNHESCTSPLAQQGDPFIPARDHPPLP